MIMFVIFKRLRMIFNSRASLIRSILYNLKFLPLHQSVYFPLIIAKGVHIYGKGKIIIDCNNLSKSRIYIGGKALKRMPAPDKAQTTIFIDGTIHLHEHFYFGSGGSIEVGCGAVLKFGNNFNSTGRCIIICRNNIEFDGDVLVSCDTMFMDSDQHTVMDLNHKNYDGAIKVGNHVWIASKVNVLKNTYIPDGCVIGCGTLLHGRYTCKNSLIAGIPAKVCRQNVKWTINKPETMPLQEVDIQGDLERWAQI